MIYCNVMNSATGNHCTQPSASVAHSEGHRYETLGYVEVWPTDERDWKRWLRDSQQAIDAATATLRSTVAMARDRGYSWRVIGDALGTTRQAACERFLRHTVTNPKAEDGL